MKEKCVLCGKQLEVLTTTPIQERQFYIEGSGQLCKECYHEVFNQKDERV